jgi:hypothetical protein
MGKFYVTTFCNFAHSLKTGRPIDHECYIIPPKLLKMEMEEDDFEKVVAAWEEWGRSNRTLVKGRKSK